MRNIVAWVIAVEIVGLAILPALRAFFANRRDAALLSRPLGLALAGWLAWALSLATPLGFSRATVILSIALMAGVSYAAARRAAAGGERFWGPEETRGALFFWIPAAIFLVVRAAVPEILGAEKFMDLAFFNSLSRGAEMPPIDPWMAGKSINYYYWGYLLAAVLTKAAGADPLVAYNLALATFGGYSFAAAACLGFRLSGGRTIAAAGAGFASVFAGNLTGAFDAWARPFAKDFDYWHASRVIGAGDTINEFPFFTFFHADLHPHLLAFPFFIAAFAVADRWIEAGPHDESRSPKSPLAGLLARGWSLFLVALTAGTAIAANLWNAPLLGVLFAVAGALRPGRGERLPPRWSRAAFGALAGAAVFLGGLLLIHSYRGSYSLPYNGLGRTTASSGLLELLGVWGLLFGVAAVGLLASDPPAADESRRRSHDFALAAAAAIAILVALEQKAPALAVILFLGFLAARAAWRALRRGQDRGAVFAAFLCLLALGMIAGCEFVHLKDSYGEKLHRMNTIFKFYHQAWPLLAIGAAVFAERAWRSRPRPRTAIVFALGAAAFAALLYPATAIVSRLRQADGTWSLDPRPAIARRNRGDLEAMEWLGKNVPHGAVVLEASGDPYTEFARISSHTGIPTVLGWANHEGLWRSNDPEVASRAGEVRRFYTTPDPVGARGVLAKYGVTHVVLGDLERTAYGGAGHVEALPFLESVHAGTTRVYRVAGAK